MYKPGHMIQAQLETLRGKYVEYCDEALKINDQNDAETCSEIFAALCLVETTVQPGDTMTGLERWAAMDRKKAKLITFGCYPDGKLKGFIKSVLIGDEWVNLWSLYQYKDGTWKEVTDAE